MVANFFIQGTELACTRSSDGTGQCTITSASLSGTDPLTFDLASVRRVEMRETRDSNGNVRYTMVVVTPSSVTGVEGYGSRGDIEGKVAAMNAFLGNPDQDRVSVRSESNLLFLAFGGVLLLFGLSFASSMGVYSTCVLDRDRNRATLRQIALTRWKRSTVDLDQISEVDVEVDDHGNNRIALVLYQGHWREPLSPVYGSDHDRKHTAARLMRKFLKL